MKLKLVKKQDEAKGTKSFFWQPEKKVSWQPGQYYYFTLPKLHYPDPKGNTRHFTISASPTEGNLLRLTTRIREESGYKKTLDELGIGAQAEGEGPNGTFILDGNETGPQIFIAGGIGITPFRAIIKYLIDKKIKTQIHLIYSNSVAEEIAFKKELEDWSSTYSNINVSMTVTKPEESNQKWNGLTGRIDATMIQSRITNHKSLAKTTFWLCGPPAMVNAMEQVLSKLNIPLGQVRSEKFTGY